MSEEMLKSSFQEETEKKWTDTEDEARLENATRDGAQRAIAEISGAKETPAIAPDEQRGAQMTAQEKSQREEARNEIIAAMEVIIAAFRARYGSEAWGLFLSWARLWRDGDKKAVSSAECDVLAHNVISGSTDRTTIEGMRISDASRAVAFAASAMAKTPWDYENVRKSLASVSYNISMILVGK